MEETKTFDFGSDYKPTTIDRVAGILASNRFVIVAMRFGVNHAISQAFVAGIGFAKCGNMTSEKIDTLRKLIPDVFDAVEQAEREYKEEEMPTPVGEA